MSRKKKQLAAAEAARKAMELQQAQQQEQAPQPTGPRVVKRKVQSVPIAPPADFIQLTPVVQPIAMVPYSTQEQPVLSIDEDDFR